MDIIRIYVDFEEMVMHNITQEKDGIEEWRAVQHQSKMPRIETTTRILRRRGI